jgi:hypothetical protein
VATEPIPLDVDDSPELQKLAEQVLADGASRVLRRDGRELAVVSPMPKPRRKRRTGIVTMDDPLMKLIGIGANADASDASSNKYKYLTEAKLKKSR